MVGMTLKRLLLGLGSTLSILLSAYSLQIALLFGWMAVTPNFPKERLEEAHWKTDLALVSTAVFLILGILGLFFLWRTFSKKPISSES